MNGVAGTAADARDVVAGDLEFCRERLDPVFRRMAGRRVLLTGGAGFLGYYLVQALQAWNRASPRDGIALTVLDNYIRGVPRWLEALLGSDLRLLTHDITTPLPDGIGDVDYIMHAASIASPSFYRLHPIETMDANVTGLRLLLEWARAQHDRGRPLKGFLFFSSSEIYGDAEPSSIPTPESYPGRVSSTGPRACYDESKRYGETLCVRFAERYGLPVTIVRPFNNYGPGLRMSDRRVIPDLARDVLSGTDLVLHSDGSPTRTFCYVADAVVGFYRVLVDGRAGEPYNVGSDGPEITVAELARQMADAGHQLFGYDRCIVTRPNADPKYLTDNPRRRCPDISKARRELGFSPEVPLAEGLRRTLLWYADHRD